MKGPVLESQVVQSIAKELGKTPAQVCLRWNLQKGNAVVFKSLSPERIRENVRLQTHQLLNDILLKSIKGTY